MTNQHWTIHPKTGFLLYPQPPRTLTLHNGCLTAESIEALETASTRLPQWLIERNDNAFWRILHTIQFTTINLECNELLFIERLFMMYGYFASAWVHGFGKPVLPAAIAQPLVALSQWVQRPPMLSYAGQVLSNWLLKDATAGFVPQNILLLQTFTPLIDESWFFRVHVAIEAQAGEMLDGLSHVSEALAAGDDMGVLMVLRTLQAGLVRITKTFHQMPDLCDPDVYFQQVRPYLMSFGQDVVYEGVDKQPAPLRGGSGAQSSIVPALLAGLGIDHETTELVHTLTDLRQYMPVEHRAFIQQMRQLRLRAYCQSRPHLADAYNHVLRQLMTFRRAHLYYARTYLFEKSTNPVGTGGTDYLAFLSKLIDETTDFLL